VLAATGGIFGVLLAWVVAVAGAQLQRRCPCHCPTRAVAGAWALDQRSDSFLGFIPPGARPNWTPSRR